MTIAEMRLPKERTKYLIILSFVYLFSQGLLLIVTGKWWDDWTFLNQTSQDLWMVASESGRLDYYPLIKFAESIPQGSYRVIVFFLFYFALILFYYILKDVLHLADRSCFLICMIFLALPVNDPRITVCCLPFSVGLFLFTAAFYLLTRMIEHGKERVWYIRLVVLLLFALSFICNSTLVLYGIAYLYILASERKAGKWLRYPDFLLLPFLFFAGKVFLFPAHGGYERYNEVTLDGLLHGVLYVLPESMRLLYESIWRLCQICLRQKPYLMMCAGLFFVIGMIMVCGSTRSAHTALSASARSDGTGQLRPDDETSLHESKPFVVLIIGGLASLAAVFPYLVVRWSSQIRHSLTVYGLDGRDMVLFPFGASMVLFVLISEVINRTYVKYIIAGFAILGVAYWNYIYLGYQEDWYRQIGFEYQLEEHEELRACRNIVCFTHDARSVDTNQFYTLNGIAYEAYGDETRLVMLSGGEVSLLNSDLSYFTKSSRYRMKDYDLGYKRLDAAIVYSNPIGPKNTLKLRWMEAFDHEAFLQWLKGNSSLTVLLPADEGFDELLAEEGVTIELAG